MAQDFERQTLSQVGTSATALGSGVANSDDAVISIRMANVTSNAITASCYIHNGSANIYIVKDISIPTGSSVELIDGASRFVIQSSDRIWFQSSASSSLDVWVSIVDAIST